MRRPERIFLVPSSRPGSLKAFTLVEVSFVLIVLGLVIMTVYPALASLRTDLARKHTYDSLQALGRASAAYVLANGCLPCPTPAATTGAGFGHVRGDTSSAACGSCSAAEGLVPFASLGLPQSAAKDGWGRWITMRVDKTLTAAFGIVPPSGTAGLCQTLLESAGKIHVRLPGTVVGTGTPAAIVFLSHGPNGFGAYQASSLATGINGETLEFPAAGSASCGVYQGYERCNASHTTDFVDATPYETKQDVYDDLLTYLGRNALVSLLGTTACTTEW